MTRVTVVEIDLPTCANTYAVAPCTASLGDPLGDPVVEATGTKKCFNCIRTCQDRGNFVPSTTTLRFCEPSESVAFTSAGLPVTVIPSMRGMQFTPAVVRPGIDIGMRETVTVSLADHPHSDAGLDSYLSSRSYDPFSQGMLWTKLRARFPSLEGAALRVLRGESGSDLDALTTYHYIIDKYTVQDGVASVTAKDLLILTDDKKSLAPRLSAGRLLGDIAADVLTLTLQPSGIGNAEYLSSGHVVIAGKEICYYTRAADVLTIVRAQLDSAPTAHKDGDAVQQVLHYDALLPSEIIADLLVNYTADFNASWIDTAAWASDVDAYIARLYSAYIAVPTPVAQLLNELVSQVSLILSTDTSEQAVRLQPLRALTSTAIVNTDVMMAGSFATREQPLTRASEVWTYYGQRNPVEPQTETRNYACTVVTVDPEAEQDYPQSAVKQIFSRWILNTNRAAVHQLNATMLARYRDPPRQFTFGLFDTPSPALGSSMYLQHWMLVDDEGTVTSVPVQITSVDISDPAMITVQAEEANFIAQPDLGGGTGTGGTTDRYVYIDVPAWNINLRTLHDAIYLAPDASTVAVFVVNAAVGALRDSAAPAIIVGDWPVGATVRLLLNARVGGYGGRGGQYIAGATIAPTAGGTGIYTRVPISVTNNSVIAGGGGGANYIYYFGFLGTLGFYETAVAGGGGAGNETGANGSGTNVANVDTPPTADLGGHIDPTYAIAGPIGGAAGASGADGSTPNLFNSPTYVDILPGAAAGPAVDGDSYITYDVLGTITGSRI